MNWDFNTNGDPYYKYILCYVDDLIQMGFNPKEDMDAFNLMYWLKEGFGPTDRYLGANVEKLQLKDKLVVCYTNCVDYLKREIGNVDNSLGVDNMAVKNYGDGNSPYSSSFRPGLDVSEERN